jgi:hypothetical protein
VSQIDNLPPDQRAVLSLLLRQGKSYGEVAGKLHIDEVAVRERAHAALASLGPRTISGLTPERREAIGDYLLGQQNGTDLDATRRYLEGSAAGRGWARVVSGEMRPLATETLPEIPAEGDAESDRVPADPSPAPAPAATPVAAVGDAPLSDAPVADGAVATAAPVADAALAGASEPAGAGPGASASEPAGAPAAGGRSGGFLGAGRASLPSSRVGGLILLVGLGAAIALVVVLLVNGGGGGGGKGSATVSAKTTTTNASTTSPQVVSQAALAPVTRGSKASGQVAVIAQGPQRALAFQAKGLPPSNGFQYALWLANSNSDASPLGLLPAVKADGASTAVEAVCGTPAAGSSSPCVPSNYTRFKLVILTRETTARPTKPGTIVLGGSLSAPAG